MVEKAAGKKPLSIAVEELYNGDVKITGADDDMEDDDIVLDYSNDMLEMSLEEESEDDQADLQTDGEEAEQEEDRDEDIIKIKELPQECKHSCGTCICGTYFCAAWR